ncbi:uncharacterized protein F4807DRAFT_233389 [Annulohypoxylon truncatum]|uniref:uncharacterized protein n=1 Tax=Annulohypoxylon truncatum TaxID=327061 RepID=UPI002008BDFD|nr:uncharacterized protein F4807DRAFT_233389 [Annulohypoxylon truncatum]KAI1206504.1 hypothetical protein F4807DRAFT_233389 [Annulohypoxylon truncatum]
MRLPRAPIGGASLETNILSCLKLTSPRLLTSILSSIWFSLVIQNWLSQIIMRTPKHLQTPDYKRHHLGQSANSRVPSLNNRTVFVDDKVSLWA